MLSFHVGFGLQICSKLTTNAQIIRQTNEHSADLSAGIHDATRVIDVIPIAIANRANEFNLETALQPVANRM